MKNCIKLFGIITLAVVIGFSFLSCEGLFSVEMTSGELIIRGLSDFNEKNVIAYGYINNVPSFMACRDLNGNTGELTYGIVRNGSVTLKVWRTTDFERYSDFSSPASHVEFRVVCYETREELRETDPDAWGVIGTVDADFQGGGKADNGQFVKGTPY
jgi:hypothetical protein